MWVKVPCPGHTGEDCAEAERREDGSVALRSSKRPGEPPTVLDAGEWDGLRSAVAAGWNV